MNRKYIVKIHRYIKKKRCKGYKEQDKQKYVDIMPYSYSHLDYTIFYRLNIMEIYDQLILVSDTRY